MSFRQRKKLFVDREVQSAILWRVVLYWFSCIAFFTLIIGCYECLARPDQMFYEHALPIFRRYAPVYLALLFLLPFLLFDAIKFSNRFCGPLRRVVDELDSFSESGTMRSLKFRDNDYWQSLADSVAKALNKKKLVD